MGLPRAGLVSLYRYGVKGKGPPRCDALMPFSHSCVGNPKYSGHTGHEEFVRMASCLTRFFRKGSLRRILNYLSKGGRKMKKVSSKSVGVMMLFVAIAQLIVAIVK